jgi:hypothetical protein
MGFVVIHLAIEVLGYLAVKMNNAEAHVSMNKSPDRGV